ncbi:elongation factor P [Candidatus Daviesbacteria bacterium RIFCSPHIGHO2_01_FULL_40_11]|uniref:Elongation factor P n=1 Tax=Candidatus Daviesbacteria bacterium RIFCSPHIGHO2_01_FULL_40_11 TaxID=1797762 RepID=A0A1F5JGS9_9BACT|nr:MAG: elongation factor P [Candidatus Daviesbacteria bacterium RIFCSPHIGHO2_01_FULL_40_11]
MALNVTDLRNGTFYKEGKDILLVLTYEHVKTGRGSGNIKLKVRNIRTGSVTEKSFITGARVDEANVEKKKAQFLYRDGDSPAGEFNFMDPVSFEQFSISSGVIGDQAKYLKDGLEVILIVSEDEALGLELPMSLTYTISETGPGEKGNTVSNVFKEATLDNGLVVKVPMFIGVGGKVKVDTRSGEYIERVK